MHIDIETLKYAMPDEIIKILEDYGSIKTDLEKRTKGGLLVFAGKSNDFKLLSGTEVKEYFDIAEKTIESSEIKGNTASLGKAIGTAKLIFGQNDFSKVKDGDILVASMTRPEMVPIMKKVSAIVTDEGGITCHAAIVSRELSIPCIIGTQVATKTLNDGDLIDVDANHGLVKIIKKAK